MPYRSMHSQVVHPVVLSIIPGLLSDDVTEFATAANLFALSCVGEDYDMPEEDRLACVGAAAQQVSSFNV